MKAVLRLVVVYFLGTPLTRALTIAGILCCLLSLYVVTSLPQSEHMLAFAVVGQAAFFLGSALMPLIFGRLSQGHGGRLLPQGRVKLLASALLTICIVALPTGLLTPLAYVAGMSGKVSDLANYPALFDFTLNLALVTYTSLCIIASWLYLIMWFLASDRSVAGFIKAMLILAIMIFLPAREIRELSATVQWNLIQLAVAWGLFAAIYLIPPRAISEGSLGRAAQAAHDWLAAFRTSGKEVDLVLGTSQPWLLLAAQLIPILIATRLGRGDSLVWLFFMVIFSTATGAISGQAAERSRRLWLRGGWSRRELFGQVERSFWRHNGIVLGVLLAVALIGGWRAGFAPRTLALGLPLVAIGTTLSSYLGLIITRGLHWPEAALGVAIMLALMVVPLMLQASDYHPQVVIGFEFACVALAIALRSVARLRGGDGSASTGRCAGRPGTCLPAAPDAGLAAGVLAGAARLRRLSRAGRRRPRGRANAASAA